VAFNFEDKNAAERQSPAADLTDKKFTGAKQNFQPAA
jgi:hypothetical protein